MQGRPEKSVCRGFAACRATVTYRVAGAVKRLLQLGMRGRMAGSTAQGSRQRYGCDPQLIREAPDNGPEPRRRVGMTRGGIGPHPQSNQQSARPRRPVLSFWFAHGDSAARSLPPFALALRALRPAPATTWEYPWGTGESQGANKDSCGNAAWNGKNTRAFSAYVNCPRGFPMKLVPPVDLTDRLPDSILDALAALYWEERINHPAVAALRP